MEKLVFQRHPVVNFATNLFINCPVILQFDDDPLIEIVRIQNIGFSTSIPIYHSDGTYLARVIGSQMHMTPEGKKAGVELAHPQGMTVCTMGNQTLFEITRTEAAALKTAAELYTRTGYFVKSVNTSPSLLRPNGEPLQIHGITMHSNTISGCRVGVWVQSNGSVSIGCNPTVSE